MPGLTSPRPQQQQQCAPDKQSWPLDLPAVTELSLSQMCFDVNRSALPTSEDSHDCVLSFKISHIDLTIPQIRL